MPWPLRRPVNRASRGDQVAPRPVTGRTSQAARPWTFLGRRQPYLSVNQAASARRRGRGARPEGEGEDEGGAATGPG